MTSRGARLFVTGSGTDVGKTYVSCLVARALVARGLDVAVRKPVITGFSDHAIDESDTARLLRASGREPTRALVDETSPHRFSRPLSPDMAARLEGRALSLDDVIRASSSSESTALTLVEGAGGVMVPIDARATTLDWIAALSCPALLVGGTVLGAMSATLTAHLALMTRAIPVAAIVVNESERSTVQTDETVASLAPHVGDTPLVVVARGAARAPDALIDAIVRACARQSA